LDRPVEYKRTLIEVPQPRLSLVRQCQLLGLSRSSLYYQPQGESEENLHLMRLLDEQYTRTPFYGVLKMTEWLSTQGYVVNPKRVRRLLRAMGLEALYPKPKTSVSTPEHKVYPYLLRHVTVGRVNQVWSCDITYVRMQAGFLSLMAVIDWFSRYVLAWSVSPTLEGEYCLQTLDQALLQGLPEVFNTDQGSQFTSLAFTGRLLDCGILISMDGRGRALDNIFVERLWRTVKYEEVYLKEYTTPAKAITGLDAYFPFYNQQRLHQSLGYKTPAVVYFGQESLPIHRQPEQAVAGHANLI
jgi:putative transposase